MPIGIAKINDKFSLQEFDDYENIPLEIVMPHPRHNSNIYRIEAVNYNLAENIKFSWTESWGYTDPPYLYITSILNEGDKEGKILEYLGNANIENVILKLDEYSKFDCAGLLKKRIEYIEFTNKEASLKAKTEYDGLKICYEKLEIQLNSLQKSYDDLLNILKSK